MKPLSDRVNQLYTIMERYRDSLTFPNAYPLAERELRGIQEASRWIYDEYAHKNLCKLMYTIGHLPDDVGIEV